MKFHRPWLRSVATVASVLFVLVACQNATDPNSSSNGPVVASSTFTIASPTRVPDRADWRTSSDTAAVLQDPVCQPTASDGQTSCNETFHLSKPLGTDVLSFELWTLGIRTITLQYTEQGSSTSLDYQAKSTAFDALDTLLLFQYANLSASLKSSFSALGTGASGLVAYYASQILSGNAVYAGKPLPVGMSADSVKKDLVYLGLEGGETVAQLTSLSVTLDAATIHALAGALVQAKLLKSSDTLDWLYPVRVLVPVSAAGNLTAGGDPVSLGGSFSWKKGSIITILPRIGTTKAGDSIPFPLERFPQASDTGWSLGGNLTVRALSATSAGTDTLMVTVSDDAGHSVQSWTLLQVVAAVKADTSTPTISMKNTKIDSTSKTAIVQVAANSSSGIDSVISRAGTSSRKRLGTSLLDTVPLIFGFNLVTDSVYASNGKQAGASDTVNLPKPVTTAPSAPPVVGLLIPSKIPDTVSWGTKNIQLSWSITESTYGTSGAWLNSSPLSAPSTGTTWSGTPQLAVGTNTFKLLAENTDGDTAYSSVVTVVRLSDTIHPVVAWQGRLATGDTLPFKTTGYTASWKVTDLDTLASVLVDGSPGTGVAQGSGVYLYGATLQLRKASKGYDTTLSLLATGGGTGDTARNVVLIHVLADTSHPVILGADSTVLPYGTTGYKFSGTVSDSDTVVVLSATAVANGQAVAASFVRTGNAWTDTVSVASSPVVVTFVATDSAGNSTTKSLTIRVAPSTADHTPPVVARSAPNAQRDTVAWDISTIPLSWAVTDNVGVATVTDNGRALTGSGGVWTDVGNLSMGLNTFVLKATDTSGNASFDTVYVFRAPDLTAPAVTRGAGTNDTVLAAGVASFTPSWTVTDNALQTVTIAGAAVTGASNIYSKSVALTSDSMLITLVATDSSGNTSRDAITVRRLAPATITGAGNSLTASVTATTAANLSGAVLTYSMDKATWHSYPTAGLSVTNSEILYVKDSVGGISQIDSAIYLFAPTITPPSGGYTAAQTVSIKDSGATSIQYYTGATAPSTWSTYSGPLSVTTCTQLHARAALGGATSNAVSATYAFPPSVSPSYGTYAYRKNVTVTAAGADSVQVSMDGASWASVTGTYTVTMNGTYYFRSAINGIFSTSTSGSYKIVHDTSLASVSLSSGSYIVNPVQSGTALSIQQDSLAFGTTSATVTVVPNDTAARVTINGGTSGGVTLVNDTATVFITVTNGPSTQTYTMPLYAHRLGTFTDARDGQTYKKVHIGSQVWMAQNLNFWYDANTPTDTFGVCYNYSTASCQQYGRLYAWHEAMGTSGVYDSTQLNPGTAYQGNCPSGWHMPTDADWSVLAQLHGDFAANGLWQYQKTNDYGFSAVPGGIGHVDGTFENLGSYAYFWAADESNSSGPWNSADARYLSGAYDSPLTGETDLKSDKRSVRCLAN
ncbi:MAG TPA: FISUMP domain-containing protein [Fibrobacteria bacterium]|nr:FISUMP domain-containing protein [Fibrobacteria bacterium]